MKDLSLHMVDILQNSITAGAEKITIDLCFSEVGMLSLTIADDGRGMTSEQLNKVKDPFFTTRTTRKIGLGISLLEQKARQADGYLEVDSAGGHGTVLKAAFQSRHPDCPPLGDIPGCAWLMMSANPDIRLIFRLMSAGLVKMWDSFEISETLDGIPFNDGTIRTGIIEWFNSDFSTFKDYIYKM